MQKCNLKFVAFCPSRHEHKTKNVPIGYFFFILPGFMTLQEPSPPPSKPSILPHPEQYPSSLPRLVISSPNSSLVEPYRFHSLPLGPPPLGRYTMAALAYSLRIACPNHCNRCAFKVVGYLWIWCNFSDFGVSVSSPATQLVIVNCIRKVFRVIACNIIHIAVEIQIISTVILFQLNKIHTNITSKFSFKHINLSYK